MNSSSKQQIARPFSIFLAAFFIVGLLTGGFLNYVIVSQRIDDLQNQISGLQKELSESSSYQNVTYIMGDNASLSQLYDTVKDSIVSVRGIISQRTFFGLIYSQVQGSGFAYNFTGRMVIITNYHVVNSAINITVTFKNGDGYAATVLGSDPYADLAILSTNSPQTEFKPLEIVSASTLNVGDPVIAIGNPFGLEGSMTTGIVSQLGRTITESTAGGLTIANVIQISAPINSGNSGGPLLNYLGQVVGITTAIVAGSQGLGFAIPSSTILQEIAALVRTGLYTAHSWLGATGTDMTYEIAAKMNVNVTYGWLITQVTNGGSADEAGLHAGTRQVQVAGTMIIVGGDIISALNGVRIVNEDDLLTYLEEYTLPGQKINITILRNNQTMTLEVILGTQPQQG